MKKTNTKNSKKAKLSAAITIMLLLICLCVFFLFTQYRRPFNSDGRENEITASDQKVDDSEIYDTLIFASDYQAMDGWENPADTLTNIIQTVKQYQKTPTNVIYCGDYTNDSNLHDYQLSPNDSIAEIQKIVGSECPNVSQNDMIFVQGNHDQLTDTISTTGLHEYDNYLVYVLNTQYDFPWKQGRDFAFKDRIISASEEMKECFNELISRGETRPVIIAGHVPLHFTARTSSRHNTGDNMYASYIFDVVNDAGKSLDIIYLFGHNHTKGWDCYLGGGSVFMESDDIILIPDAENETSSTDKFTKRKLTFTYMNAGYTGYYMNCGPEELDNGTASNYSAADETLTATTCEILPNEIIITRFSKEGQHQLSCRGEANPYKGGIDEGLIDAEYYSLHKEGPAHIVRKARKRN